MSDVPKIVETIPHEVSQRAREVLAHPQLRHLLRMRGGAGDDLEERLALIFEVYTRPRLVLTGDQERLQELGSRLLRATSPRALTPDEEEFRSKMLALLRSLPRNNRAHVLDEPPRRLTEDEEAVRLSLLGAVMRSTRLIPAERWRVLSGKLGAWFDEMLDATGAPTMAAGPHEVHAGLLALRDHVQAQFPGLQTKRDLNAAIALIGTALGVDDLDDDLKVGLDKTPIDVDALATLDRRVRAWSPRPTRRRRGPATEPA